jgi:type II secretory pathway component PulJ
VNEVTPEQIELERQLRGRVRRSLALMAVLSLVAIAAAVVVAMTMTRQRDRLQERNRELQQLAGELRRKNDELVQAHRKLQEQFDALVAVTRAAEQVVVKAVPEGDRNPVIREVQAFIRDGRPRRVDTASTPGSPDRDDAVRGLERARRLVGQGDREAARREVELALKKSPDLISRVRADKALRPLAPGSDRPTR